MKTLFRKYAIQTIIVVELILASTFVVVAFQQPTDKQVCSGKLCVPVEVFTATFKDYQTGDPSPVLMCRQEVINSNAQFADALQRERSCLGQLGPAQAAQHQQMLRQQQDALTKELESDAPAGMQWDSTLKKYVTKKG